MKKFVFSFCLLLGVAGTLSAQTTERIKPVAGDMGIGFKLTGISNVSFNDWKADHFNVPQLLYRYYVADKFAIRASVGFSMVNKTGAEKYENIVGATRTLFDSTYSMKSMNFSFDPGFEYHLGSPATKVDPYIGLTVPISYQGATETETRIVTDDFDLSSSTYLFQSDLTTRVKTPGGLGIGGGFLLGFNYFFSDNFAIGAEYIIGASMVNTGGDRETSVNGFTGVPGSITPISTTTRTNIKTGDLNGSIRSTGGVNVSVFW